MPSKPFFLRHLSPLHQSRIATAQNAASEAVLIPAASPTPDQPYADPVVAVALLFSLGFSPAGIAASTPQILGPTLLYQDSIILQETGEDFVAAPTGMLPGPDESFLIPDLFANRVFQFDADGKLVRAFGRPGQGPGEFTRVVDVGFASDSVFVVLDALALELEVFDFHTGEHIGAVGIEAHEHLSSMSLVGDSVWFAGMNSEGWKAVGVVSVDELVAMARQGAEAKRVSFLDRVDVPGVYVMNPRMFGSLGRAVLDVGASDLLVGFAGTAFLMRFVQGAVADTLWLAHRRSRRKSAMPRYAHPDFGHRCAEGQLVRQAALCVGPEDACRSRG